MSKKFFITALVCALTNQAFAERITSSDQPTFRENKGQIKDQRGNKRSDILYYGTSGAMTYYLQPTGISYQLYKINGDSTTVQRIDIRWIDANPKANIKTEQRVDGKDHYILNVESLQDIKTFSKVTYQGIYKGIDLKFYQQDGQLKYDFIVHPGADYQQIRMEVNGATPTAKPDGAINLYTPLGIVEEGVPFVYQEYTTVTSSWNLNNHTITLDVGNFDRTKPLIIDPVVRQWSTYYGGTSGGAFFPMTQGFGTTSDANGNVFMCGQTNATTNIATTGAYQTTLGNVTNTLGFVAKFSPAGIREWGSYLGPTAPSGVTSAAGGCATDASGNVYVTLGSILYKFNSGGTFQWSTTAAGLTSSTGIAMFNATRIAVSSAGQIYVAGGVSSATANVATSGAFQTTGAGGTDGYLGKFDPDGTRIWATFYGGPNNDMFSDVSIAANGDVLVGGQAGSGTNLATAGTFDPNFNSITNASRGIIVRFDSNGNRVWASYYGPDTSKISGIGVDNNDNIFAAGTTSNFSSSADLSTVGGNQALSGGGARDGFVARFTGTGQRVWGSYFGGNMPEEINDLAMGAAGRFYICGVSYSENQIATPGSFIDTFATTWGGNKHAPFLAEFDSSGKKTWATYYGMALLHSYASSCEVDPSGNVFVAGTTSSGVLGTTGSHKPAITSTSGWDAFLAKFSPCSPTPISIATNPSPTVCAGTTALLTATAITGATYQWFLNDVKIPGATSAVYAATVAGSYLAVAISAGCPAVSDPVVIDIHPNPLASITKTDVSCFGGNNGTILVTPSSGLAPYSFSWTATALTGNNLTGLAAGTYGLTLTDANGCFSQHNININEPLLLVTSKTQVNLTCAGMATGAATITPSGGNPPYFYSWSNSGSTSTVSNLPAGTYYATVTDNKGCIQLDSFTVTEPPMIIATITQTDNACFGAATGQASAVVSGGVAPYSYSWNNGSQQVSSSSTAASLSADSYILNIVDANNCSRTDTVQITEPLQALADVCAVTFDSSTGKNLIIWEKSGVINDELYKVYRETFISGQYNLIGAKYSNEMSTLLDTSSNPLQQSYTYRVSVVDSCGLESPLSTLHKTIHLTANTGVNGEINLIWNAYEGKSYSTHKIMRSINAGTFMEIDQVAATSLSYSDLAPPAGQKEYRIDVDLPTSCNPTAKTTAYSLISSNLVVFDPLAVGNPGFASLLLYPNPTGELLYVRGEVPTAVQVRDISGRLVIKQGRGSAISLHGLPSGVYTVQLFDGKLQQYHREAVIKK